MKATYSFFIDLLKDIKKRSECLVNMNFKIPFLTHPCFVLIFEQFIVVHIVHNLQSY